MMEDYLKTKNGKNPDCEFVLNMVYDITCMPTSVGLLILD